ncbi:MAG: serine/threonine protein kinase [Candidatus Obscuribacterales bacterium]|nr:serine/threonine protein kinase [Candidatus Obscuribacterales bacterium]
MSDQDNRENRGKDDKLQKAIKKAGSKSFGVQKKSKKPDGEQVKSVLDRLDELEQKYVTRPSRVPPPLPSENPESIKRSGVQKRYDPRDKSQFPEESAYDMKPFILEENRLNLNEQEQEQEQEQNQGEENKVESTKLSDPQEISGVRQKPDLFGSGEFESIEKSIDLLGEDSIYEMEPIVLPGYQLNITDAEDSEDGNYLEPGADPLSGAEVFPEHSQFEMAPIVVQNQEQDQDQAKVEEETMEFSELSGEEFVSASDSDSDSEPESDVETETTMLEPGHDPVSAIDRLPEDSIYEMTPIVIPHQERKAEKSESMFPDVRPAEPAESAPDEVLQEASQETSFEPEPEYNRSNYIEPGQDPISAMEPLPEDSIYELDPIVLPDQKPLPQAEIARRDLADTQLEFDVHTDNSLTGAPGLGEVALDETMKEPVDIPENLRQWEDTDTVADELVDQKISRTTPRFSAPLISLARDNMAPGSEIETAAIAKEIATHQSMSAVTESRIQQALEQDPNVTAARQRPGQTLEDKYLITGIIGQGGISVVYKARDLATNQIVAVKTLKENKPDIAMRFKREIETLTTLQHKNIVRAVEAITLAPGQTFLVMEHVKGISLQELIKQYGRAEHPEVIASILTQVCDGLAHAHKHKIIHRDLKGGNIVLTNVGEKIVVKILDFGIAKLEDDMQRLTLEGKAMGSPLFMSPEQCKGETLTVRSDLYSLGIVAYELITGELPVKGRSIVDVMAKHCDVNYRPRPVSDHRADLPAVHMLDQIIAKALETEVDKRLRTIEQFKDGIEYWIGCVRSKELDRDLPPGMLESTDPMEESVKAMKLSLHDLNETRNEALKTGVSFSAVKEEKERTKKKARGLKPIVLIPFLLMLLALVAYFALAVLKH